MKSIIIIFNIVFLFTVLMLHAQEDGHQLWLRDKKALPVTVVCKINSPTFTIARRELQDGWQGKGGATLSLVIKTNKDIKSDGFRLNDNVVEANTENGILYGVYELLRRQQTGEAINNEVENPSYEIRIFNHWDNPDGSVERGYAGNSIFWRKEDPFTVTAGSSFKTMNN